MLPTPAFGNPEVLGMGRQDESAADTGGRHNDTYVEFVYVWGLDKGGPNGQNLQRVC